MSEPQTEELAVGVQSLTLGEQKLDSVTMPTLVDIPDGKACPFCGAISFKDGACSYVVCGLFGFGFYKNANFCARAFCFDCSRRYCGVHFNTITGARLDTYRNNHDNECCRKEKGFRQEDYCPGGHNPHCAKRW